VSRSAFVRALCERSRAPGSLRDKQWVYVPYDQLTFERDPLSRGNPGETCAVLIESAARPARRPYHKKTLAFVLSNEQHFALEFADRGFAVLYRSRDGSFAEQLRDAMREHGQREVLVQRPAERELREELASVQGLRVVGNELWLTSEEDFARACGARPWRGARPFDRRGPRGGASAQATLTAVIRPRSSRATTRRARSRCPTPRRRHGALR
jgi:deoxyribodipyrimidine photolyase-like uncharacterized protein